MYELEDYENIYHITWVTHNSRVSERMVFYNIKRGEPLILTNVDKKEIENYLKIIIFEDHLKVIEFIVNSDHVHLILICKETLKSNIIRKLKGKSTQLYKDNHKIYKEFHLWAQKYNSSLIKNERELENVINYVKYNDLKHTAGNKG